MLKIVHTADVHLGAYSVNNPAQRETQMAWNAAFAQVISIAIEENADLFVIAGDFFDSNRPPDDAVEFAIEQLRRLPMPTILLPGNHDCVSPTSVYRRVDFDRECNNLHVIMSTQGERHTFSNLDLAIWGKADNGEAVFRPLADPPPRGSERWHIAVGHGHVLLPDVRQHTSLPITLEEIATCGMDYVALGHWDHHRDVSQGNVRAVYAGAPMLFSAAWTKKSGYAALVTLDGSVAVQQLTIQPPDLASEPSDEVIVYGEADVDD